MSGAASPFVRRRVLYENSLSGTIPTEVGLLTSMTGLGLGDNSLSGTMPSDICSLIIVGELSDCHLQDISFACPLPPCASKCAATCK